MESKEVKVGLTTFYLEKRPHHAGVQRTTCQIRVGTRGDVVLSDNTLERLIREVRIFTRGTDAN